MQIIYKGMNFSFVEWNNIWNYYWTIFVDFIKIIYFHYSDSPYIKINQV